MSHSSNRLRVEFQVIYFMIKVGRLIDVPPQGGGQSSWTSSQEAFNSAVCFSLSWKVARAAGSQPTTISPCSTSKSDGNPLPSSGAALLGGRVPTTPTDWQEGYELPGWPKHC